MKASVHPKTIIHAHSSRKTDEPSRWPAGRETSDEEPVRRGIWPLLRALKFWRPRPESSLKEALTEVIEEHEELADKPLPVEEKRILHNVLSFSDITVSDIMTPRSDIDAVPHDIGLPALREHIQRYRHTRIPIYQDTLDTMLGFIHVKDLLPMLANDMGFEIRALLRDLLFVPPSMRIIDLLVKMRQSRIHMAIVVDEHGGTDGLVTMEDMFEEVFGDIQDEHDSKDEEQSVARISDHVIEVNARIHIDTLERQLGRKLVTEGEGEFNTLGGFIFFHLGRVPVKGEVVPHASGVKFEIMDADPRRIRKVRILMR